MWILVCSIVAGILAVSLSDSNAYGWMLTGHCLNQHPTQSQINATFVKWAYPIESQGDIVVNDPFDKGRVRNAVTITSEVDHHGIELTLKETPFNSGTFIGKVLFTAGQSNQNEKKLHVGVGKWVNMIYDNENFSRTLIIDSTTPISTNYGTYIPGSSAIIYVIDCGNDYHIPINVNSTADPAGINMNLYQISPFSGIYSNPSGLQLLNLTQNSQAQDNTTSLKVAKDTDQLNVHYAGFTKTANVTNNQKILLQEDGLGACSGNNCPVLPASFLQGSPTYNANCANFGGNTMYDGVCDGWKQSNGALNISIPGYTAYNFPMCTSSVGGNNGACMGSANANSPNAIDPDGLNPSHQDILVALDWYTADAPDPNALADIVTAFAKHGVHLHFQLLGTTLGGNYRYCAQYYGPNNAVSSGSAIHAPPTSWPPGLSWSTYSLNFPTEFNVLKFDRLAVDKYTTTNICSYINVLTGYNSYRIDKAQVFHYGLYAYQFSYPPAPGQTPSPTLFSGVAEVLGNDFLVTLDNWTQGLFSTSGVSSTPSTDLQEGTIMHELGHNLGLQHGGNDAYNCKPHYFSVMNYLYQFKSEFTPPPGGQPRSLNYSDFVSATNSGNPLDETNLNELQGLDAVPTTTAPHFAVFATPATTPSFQVSNMLSTTANTQIDWGGDDLSGNLETSTNSNIDNFGISDCYGTAGATSSTGTAGDDVLHGYNDWNNLQLNFRTSSNFENGMSGLDPNTENEMTQKTLDNIMKMNLNRTAYMVHKAIHGGTYDGMFADAASQLDNGNVTGAVDKLHQIDSAISGNDEASGAVGGNIQTLSYAEPTVSASPPPVTYTVEPLASGDPTCPYGGLELIGSNGSINYVCNSPPPPPIPLWLIVIVIVAIIIAVIAIVIAIIK